MFKAWMEFGMILMLALTVATPIRSADNFTSGDHKLDLFLSSKVNVSLKKARIELYPSPPGVKVPVSAKQALMTANRLVETILQQQPSKIVI